MVRSLVDALGAGVNRKSLGPDAIASIAVLAALLPQTLAAAWVAGVPLGACLAAAASAMLLYAVIGASPRAIVAPELPLALLTAAASAAAAQGRTDPAVLASLLAVMVGVICLAGGVAGTGFVADLLPRPILAGFRTGAAIVIAWSQVPVLFGLPAPHAGLAGPITEVVANWRLHAVRPFTLVLALLALGTVVGLRRRLPRAPELIALALTTMLVAFFNLDRAAGVAVIGQAAPSAFSLTVAGTGELASLVPAAFVLALIALAETADVRGAGGAGDGLSRDREMAAIGVSNLAAGLIHGIPVTASRAQTAIAAEAGARTRLAGVMCAILLVVATVLIAPYLRQVPAAAIAVVVIVASVRLADPRMGRWLADRRHPELVQAFVTLAAVLGLGVLIGAMVAAVLAVLGVLRRMSRPRDALLRLAGQSEAPEALVYRLEAPLCSTNAGHLEERIHEALAAAGTAVRWLVVDAGASQDLDSGAAEALARLHAELAARDVTLAIAGAGHHLRASLLRTELVDRIGVDNLHATVTAAVARIRRSRGWSLRQADGHGPRL